MIRTIALLMVVNMAATVLADDAARRTSFNADWRFKRDDPEGTDGKLAYPQIKQWVLPGGAAFSKSTTQPARPAENVGRDVVYTQSSYDDGAWRKLNLPHDWAIEGPFKQELPGETGKLPYPGVGWYRKHFTLAAEDKGKQIYLDIDGAMSYSTVWVNGQFAGGWPYGYASWRVNLTPFAKAGQENVVAIRLENLPESSRWYPGAGIYRNVWLVKTSPVHVGQWGVYVTTPTVTKESATIDIKTTIENNGDTDAKVQVATEIYEADPAGNKSGKAIASVNVDSLNVGKDADETSSSRITLPNPKLWSTKSPAQYVAVSTVKIGDKAADTCETRFGIRTVQFTVDNGCLINGQRVPLNGVCDHHDLGALGTAINIRALERQLEILKEMGCNAIRTSHNPPAPELLDLCDRIGFVVMDEAFDMWAQRKKKNDYHLVFGDWHEKDMRSYIRRDRNHASVILWSIGNEIPEQGNPKDHYIGAELTAIAHDEDPTRPTVSACNNGKSGFNGFSKVIDVFGDNYQAGGYAKIREANPDQPMLASETSSCVSTRGEYFFPVDENKAKGLSDFQVSSYDLYAPRWAMPPDPEFKQQEMNPFMAGEFVWTGFDYIGEPTPYNSDSSNLLNFTDKTEQDQMAKDLKALGKIHVPSRSSYFGIVDLAGFKKDRFYIYQAHWRPELPMAHILPHWNWPDRVGEVTPVHVYTSGDEAELFLNGKSLGRKTKEKFQYRLRWDDVKYEPGELRVVAYKAGKQWADETVKTTDAPAKVLLKADRETIAADGADLSFVTVTIADKDGLMVPRSKNLVKFELTGPGDIAAVDNGDPTSFDPFQASERKAFNGLALVIIRSRPGDAGKITLKATSDQLETTSIDITTTMAK